MTKPVITSFNTLAPLIIQQYERYLPSAFDDGLTMLEKVNKVIEYLNRMGELNNSVVEQWNSVMEWVMNEGLSTEVQEKLDEMVADGTMDSIINQTIFGELNDKIDGLIMPVANKTTLEIQQTIDDFHNLSTIYFPNTPSNVYVIDQTIKIPSNTRIKIADGVTLRLANFVNNPIFENDNKLNGNSNISIVGGTFDVDGTNQNTKSPAVSFHNVSNARFENMTIMPTKRDNVYVGIGSFDLYRCTNSVLKNIELYDSGDEGLFLRECSNCKVKGGSFHDCVNGSGVACDLGEYNEFDSVLSYGNTGSNFSINSPYSLLTNCVAKDGLGNNAITLGHSGKPANYTVVSNCIVENNPQGIRVLASSIGVVITDNIVRNNIGNAIGIGISDLSSDCIVANNHVTGNYDGIYVYSLKKSNIVKGNFVKSNRHNGIVVNDSENNVVDSNVCENNGLFGINLTLESKNNIISNNRCFDSQTTKTQQRGIYSDGSNNTFLNNILHGNEVTALSVTTDNNVSNNMLSDTDPMVVQVTINNTQATTAVYNDNILPASKISFYLDSPTATNRQIIVSDISVGVIVLGHTIDTTTDTLTLVIH